MYISVCLQLMYFVIVVPSFGHYYNSFLLSKQFSHEAVIKHTGSNENSDKTENTISII